MIYADYRKGKVENTLEVDIICSKCKKVHPVIIDRVSKLSMSICPYCNNIDLERTAGKISASTEKYLRSLMDKGIPYTVEGLHLVDFIDDIDMLDVLDKEELNDSQSYGGLYRLKSYYNRAKAKGQLNIEDFPSFEDFMRWSIKQGYRDWKTLKTDDTNFISKASTWVPGGYTKNVSTAMKVATEYTTLLHNTRQQLTELIANNTDVNGSRADAAIITSLVVDTIKALKDFEIEVMNNL